MRFRIIGGYAIFTTTSGMASGFAASLSPYDVEAYLWAEATDLPPYPPVAIPAGRGQLVHDLRVFLRRYRVGTVLAIPNGGHPRAIERLFVRALGAPSAVDGNVTAWYGVQKRLAHPCAASCPVGG
jgi:hypothetical protein